METNPNSQMNWDCHRQPQQQEEEEAAVQEVDKEEEDAEEEQPKARIAHFRSSKYFEINQSSRQGDWLGSEVHRESLIDVPCLRELSIVECLSAESHLLCYILVCSEMYGRALYQ